MSNDAKAIQDEFHQAMNMTAKQLESWLATEELNLPGRRKTMTRQLGTSLANILWKFSIKASPTTRMMTWLT